MVKGAARENNTLLYVALGVAAALLLVAVVSMRLFLRPPPAPAPVAAAAVPPEVTPEVIGRAPALYQEELHADAQRFGLPDVTPDSLMPPLTHTVEIGVASALRPGEVIETPHLRIAARTEKRDAQGDHGEFRAEHLLLIVENRTDQPLAYRVDTGFAHPERCGSRGLLLHNAIAIPAHGKVERTECLFHPGLTLVVEHAETITLPPIGYFYVSQLVPTQIGLDSRSSDGHAAPRPLATCNLPYWREFAAWGLGWADLIDFFARHDCQKFAPFKEYRFRTAPGPLPAHA